MPIEKPRKANIDLETRVATLTFGRGEEEREERALMAGGVVWPMLVERGRERDFEGFLLLGGVDVDSGKLTVYEQHEFNVVTYDPAKGPAFKPCAAWFVKMWARYYARRFYWFQPDDLHKSFALQVSRDELIQPRPVFVEAPWVDDEDSEQIVWRAVAGKEILYDRDSPLAHQLREAQVKGEQKPAVRALQHLLLGIRRYETRNILGLKAKRAA